MAQPGDYYAQTADARRVRWQLFTDATNQRTCVRFFNDSRQVVYEEVLPGRHITLSRRNIDRLNAMSERMVSGHLLAGSLHTESLTDARPVNVSSTELTTEVTIPTEVNNRQYPLYTESFHQPKLELLVVRFTNPDLHRLTIKLKDVNGQIAIERKLDADSYNGKFDLAGLSEGNYTLVVETPDRQYRYSRPVIIVR
ncbi:hypothetical protein GCM10023189_09540 [Nibrella saemangeumensis]|uniref:Por secretion system C-terminal sorting domain-containing protein n=1 Tax=Nibrella saemangeumensis TaxID=1084526 RepID=A0ABP8MFS9_9BACT